MKTILSLFVILLFSNVLLAQTTAIPDANFEQALINLGYDTGVTDGTVPTANINIVTVLDVSIKNISDLTGIEDFAALADLNCSDNNLISLDVSQNLALTVLKCTDIPFLTSLDVTQNTALIDLRCYQNQLTSLDVTQNTDLTGLGCFNNQLTSLDVTQNTVLDYLQCNNNQLTNLDVTQNTALTYLKCGSNQLTNLDVTQNTALTYLNCGWSQLTSLDVTQNHALTRLTCASNQLNCLNVKNGNNNNFTIFDATGNPNLTCIEVDNVAWSTTNWTDIDPAASFSTNCSNSCSTVGINEYDISNVSIYPNPTQGTFTIETPNQEDYSIEVINITGKVIYKEQIKIGGIKQIDLGEYSKGIYFLKLTNHKESIVEKIVYK